MTSDMLTYINYGQSKVNDIRLIKAFYGGRKETKWEIIKEMDGGDINGQTRRQIDQGSYGQGKVMNCLTRKGQRGGGWTGEYSRIGPFLFLINFCHDSFVEPFSELNFL